MNINDIFFIYTGGETKFNFNMWVSFNKFVGNLDGKFDACLVYTGKLNSKNKAMWKYTCLPQNWGIPFSIRWLFRLAGYVIG